MQTGQFLSIQIRNFFFSIEALDKFYRWHIFGIEVLLSSPIPEERILRLTKGEEKKVVSGGTLNKVIKVNMKHGEE